MDSIQSLNVEVNTIESINWTFEAGSTSFLFLNRPRSDLGKKNNLNNCTRPIEPFLGRDEKLSELDNLLNEHKMVAMHGTAGVGKTQLARKYAADNDKKYSNLFNLEADTEVTLFQSLEDLARELGIPPQNHDTSRDIIQIRNEIYDELKKKNTFTLLIFDNIINPALTKYLPSVTELNNSKLHVLLIGQYTNWPNVKCMDLRPLDEENSLKLLDLILDIKSNKQLITDKDKLELIQVLEGIPVTIHISASYINTQMELHPGFLIRPYINKLKNDNYHKLNNYPSEMNKTLNTSIQTSLEFIKQENSDAMKLLSIMTSINPNVIEKEVLRNTLNMNDCEGEDKFNEAFELILNYSLIYVIDEKYFMFRTIQDIIRYQLNQ